MNMLSSVVLVVTTLTIALGLGAVTASLTPSLATPKDPAYDQLLVGVVHAVRAPDKDLPGVSRALSQPLLIARDRGGAPTPAALPRVSATGPWKSPLYPQNGVTLWDRIRVSTQRDRRAFLLGTALQLHAGAAAASPIPTVSTTRSSQHYSGVP
jgi:hypothetical protein